MTYLVHHGILGMKWGVRRTPEQLGHASSTTKRDLLSLANMMDDIGYDATNHKLKTPKETLSSEHGNCHDQVLLELDQLRKKGYNPKARFVIEVNPETGQGGRTHSFVYLQKDGTTIWFENAWGDQAGIREYSSLKDLEKDVTSKWGVTSNYPELVWGDFDDSKIKPGQTLQQIVDNVVWDD